VTVIVSGFTISSGTHGVTLSYCQNITVEDNEIHNQKSIGINLYLDCNDNKFKNNNITSCRIGINLVNFCERNLIYNNTIKDNDNEGIYLDSFCNKNNVTENLLEGNGLVGGWALYLRSSDYNNITHNTVISNYYGMHIFGSDYNRIFNNTANDNDHVGIHIRGNSHNNTIFNNTASETSGGLGQNIGIRIEGSGLNPTGNNIK